MRTLINIVTVIQARMNSTRLPGKIMKPLAGKPLLIRMVERVKVSKLSGTVVVATTTEEADEIIYKICKEENIPLFRGHPTDLLDRHYKTGLKYEADVVVKIPSDCPLIDPSIIKKVLKYYLDNKDLYDYVSNLHPATYPDGNDVEVMSMECLSKAWQQAKKSFEREHTTPYIWENPHLFRIGNLDWEPGLDFSMTYRWTIDYEEDYQFIKKVYDELYPINPHFSLYDILSLLQKKPELKEINKKYNGVNWYRNYLDELNTIMAEQTKQV